MKGIERVCASLLLSALIAPAALATPVTSGLDLWLDATDSATVFDGTGLNPGDSGFSGGVSLWSDKSGAGRDASSAGALQPTYDSSAMNGKPAITFSGNAFFDLASAVSSSEETIFLVTRMFTNGDNEGPWLGNSTDGPGHGVPGAFFNDNDRYFVATGDGLFGFVSAPSPTTDTILMEIRSGDVVSVLENGSIVLSGLAAPGTMEINTVGWFPFGDRHFFGEISEILVYSRTLSDSEVGRVQNYLSAKYAIPVESSGIPEPATLALLGVGLVGLGAMRHRRSAGRPSVLVKTGTKK